MATLTEHLSTKTGKRATRWIGAGLAALVVLLIGAGVWLHHWIESEIRHKLFRKWSFQYQSDVSVGRLSISVFPAIRIVGHDLVFRLHDDPKSPPLVHAGRVIVTSGIVALFKSPHRFRHIEVFDAEANIPPHWEGPKSDGKPKPDHPKVEAGQIEIANSVVRLLGEHPLVFPIRSIRFRGPGLGRHMDFKVDMHNAKPPGRIEAEGRFGPWNPSRSAELPLSGRYRLTNADLGAFGGIGGTLDSEGEFKGVLRRLATSGIIHVGGFEVTEAGHAVPLAVKFEAVVDGTNGNVALPSVAAGFLHTRVEGHGGFETPDDGGKGKQFKLEAAMQDGRLDEILRLSLHDARPAFGGTIRFQSLLLIPPGDGDLVDRLHIDADVGMDSVRPRRFRLKQKLDELSAKAQGDPQAGDEIEVWSDLRGHVNVRNGIAHLTGVSFRTPGVYVTLAGTYALRSEILNLHGTARLEAKLSQTTTGVKSFFLKLVDPFAKNKKTNSGTQLPITITGPARHPKVGVTVLGHHQ